MSALDPRLLLSWYRFTPPNAGSVIFTIFDASKDNSGLGLVHGVVSYRDMFGRVGQVEKKKFDQHSTLLDASQIAPLLPASTKDLSFIRFPGLKERFEKRYPQKTKVASKAPSRAFKSVAKKSSGKISVSGKLQKRSKTPNEVVITVKPKRSLPPKTGL